MGKKRNHCPIGLKGLQMSIEKIKSIIQDYEVHNSGNRPHELAVSGITFFAAVGQGCKPQGGGEFIVVDGVKILKGWK